MRANTVIGVLFIAIVVACYLLYRAGVAAGTIIAYNNAARLNALRRSRHSSEEDEDEEAAEEPPADIPGAHAEDDEESD